MSTTEKYLGKYLLWEGELTQIHSVSEKPTVHFVVQCRCPHCDGLVDHTVSVIPETPLWEEKAKPIESIPQGPELLGEYRKAQGV